MQSFHHRAGHQVDQAQHLVRTRSDRTESASLDLAASGPLAWRSDAPVPLQCLAAGLGYWFCKSPVYGIGKVGIGRAVTSSRWGYGATAARLTPDQKVGSSNLSALNFHSAFPGPCPLQLMLLSRTKPLLVLAGLCCGPVQPPAHHCCPRGTQCTGPGRCPQHCSDGALAAANMLP